MTSETSTIQLKECLSLHDVRIDPQKFEEVVEHYSIPLWESLSPEFIQSNDIQSGKILLPDGEHILVSCLNPSTHKVWRVEKNNSGIKRVASTEWAVVIPHNEKEIDYINSALESHSFQFEMNSYVTGTTNSHQRVKKHDFLNLNIPFSDKKTRMMIGEIHKLCREKIACNNKLCEYYSHYISELYRSWFIDFNPVKAKEEGKLPYGMDRKTAALFPGSFEDSELGPIPSGWDVGTVHDIAKQRKEIVKPDVFEDTTHYIGLEHIPRNSIALTKWGISNGLESNKFRFSKGDFLFGKLRPYFHKVGPAPVDGICSTDILVIQPINSKLGAFLFPIISSENFVNFVSGITEGVGLPRTKWEHFKLYRIALPPVELREEFVSLVEPMMHMVEFLIHESKSLEHIKESLLTQL